MRERRSSHLLLATLLATVTTGGCGPRAPRPAGLPPVPARAGPLVIDVVYPPEGSFIAARDSNFIFGSVGHGGAELTIDGVHVPVEPNGAFLAWLPVPVESDDTLATYRLSATLSDEVIRIEHSVRVPATPSPLSNDRPAIDTARLAPRGTWWVREGELIVVHSRASPGADVRLRFPSGDTVALAELPRSASANAPRSVAPESGEQEEDTTGGSGLYVAEIVAREPLGRGRLSPTLLPVPGEVAELAGFCSVPAVADSLELTDPTASREPRDVQEPFEPTATPKAPDGSDPLALEAPKRPSRDTDCAVVEVVLGGQTARAPLPLDLWILREPGPVVRLREELTEAVGSDGFVIGRAGPGATTLWQWAAGVEARVTGRRDGVTRIRLDQLTEAWVAAEEAIWRPGQSLSRPARVGTVRLEGLADRVRVVISVGEPLPYRVEMDGTELSLILYGAYADTDWLRYGPADEFVRSARWEQVSSDRYVVRLNLTAPPWGYRVRYGEGAVILDVRKPPPIDPERPLAGRLIAVDPGHPPAGATGPTRLYEGDVNLAIALKLKRLLEAEGSRVVLTRAGEDPVRLYDRTHRAEIAGAEALVSIHNNALPDGVNPFGNHGTSVFYFHPPSLPLAHALQRGLLDQLGLEDLGIGRASLALVRPTWMPASLTEGAFMMIPAQEAALKDPRYQEAYARGVLEGLRAFFRERAK